MKVTLIKTNISNLDENNKPTDKSKYYVIVTAAMTTEIDGMEFIDKFNAIVQTTAKTVEALNKQEKGYELPFNVQPLMKSDEITGQTVADCIAGTSIVKATAIPKPSVEAGRLEA